MFATRSNLKFLVVVGVIVLIGGGILVWVKMAKAPSVAICSQEAKLCLDGSSVGRTGSECQFAECPVVQPLEIVIYCTNDNCQPQQVMTGAGTLVQGCYRNLGECQTASSGLIKIEKLQVGQVIKSPLIIKGQARGPWYFEAVFPIRLYDGAGEEIASTQARALSDWMTDDFVPFEATLTFKVPASATGTLVFIKDNPSGLPQHDDKLILPISF